MTAARHHPDVAVAYHGGDTEKYLGEARGISAPLLMHLAEEDEFISKELHESAFGTKQTSRRAQPMSALGVKRTLFGPAAMSAFDPKRTLSAYATRSTRAA